MSWRRTSRQYFGPILAELSMQWKARFRLAEQAPFLDCRPVNPETNTVLSAATSGWNQTLSINALRSKGCH